MHEKTLLYGALAATALAAVFGIHHARARTRSGEVPVAILPVSHLDGPKLPRGEVPFQLTGSDGQGLRLRSLSARAAIEDPLALTEIHLVFENPEDRVLEGRFNVVLPQRASVSRFAMKIGDIWQEGEVVEKARARVVYDDFLHQRQDPALLEQGGGNTFTARVFPIPAKGTKEIVIAYSEVLDAAVPYALPLEGLPLVNTLDIDVRATGTSGRDARFEVHEHDLAPAKDFVVDPKSLPRSPGLRSEELVVARVVPFGVSRPEPIAGAVFLVDTSASRTLGLAAQASLVRGVIARLPAKTPVTVGCFDQEVVSIYSGAAGGFGDDAERAIVARGALGASDVQRALAWAGVEAKKRDVHRVVLVSDGVATAGEMDGERIKREVEKLRTAGIERIDAVAIGGIRDDGFLRALVRGVLDRDGAVLDAAIGAQGLAHRLGEATSSGVAVRVPGATWSWPRTLDGLQAGDEVLVHAEVPASSPVKIEISGQEFAPDLRRTERSLVERACARAKIESLIEAPTSDPEETRRQIVALSTRHRVLSPHTALLVLESENDYVRNGIPRGATKDILTVEEGRVAVQRRTTSPAVGGEGETEKKKAKEPLPRDDGGWFGKGRAQEQRAPAPSASAATTSVDRMHVDRGGFVDAPPPPPRPPVSKRPRAIDHEDPWARPPPHPSPTTTAVPVAPPPAPTPPAPRAERSAEPPSRPETPTPYEGRLKIVMDLLARGQAAAALEEARRWHDETPGDILALVALGEAFEASGDVQSAARAYGSILELYPSRVDARRYAGERLERLKDPGALALAIDTYAKAVADRPDHPSGHRLYAFALLKHGDHEKAFEALRAGVERTYAEGRFRGADRVLREDLGLIAAAWKRAAPARAREIGDKLRAAGGHEDREASLRAILVWETDANDVDLHVFDERGGHAYYGAKSLASGGELYDDVTTGYGPECFTVRGDRRAARYTFRASYYARGPMGYGMGKLELIEHDGHGVLAFEERPFVVMSDHAAVDLGARAKPSSPPK